MANNADASASKFVSGNSQLRSIDDPDSGDTDIGGVTISDIATDEAHAYAAQAQPMSPEKSCPKITSDRIEHRQTNRQAYMDVSTNFHDEPKTIEEEYNIPHPCWRDTLALGATLTTEVGKQWYSKHYGRLLKDTLTAGTNGARRYLKIAIRQLAMIKYMEEIDDRAIQDDASLEKIMSNYGHDFDTVCEGEYIYRDMWNNFNKRVGKEVQHCGWSGRYNNSVVHVTSFD
jgi:hypothetical protein